MIWGQVIVYTPSKGKAIIISASGGILECAALPFGKVREERMDHKYIEMTPGLIAELDAADRQVDAAHDRLAAAQSARQSLLNDCVANIAQFKAGDDVINGGQKFRITKIRGEEFRVTGISPKVSLKYYGVRVKKDGSTTGRERWLYNIRTLEGSEAEA